MKRIFYMVMALVLAAGGMARADIPVFDSFETSLGNWTSEGGAVRVAVNPYSGIYTARIQRSDGTSAIRLTNPLQLSTLGYTSVTLAFTWIGDNGGGTVRFMTEYSVDGGTNWTQIDNLQLGTTRQTYNKTFTPSSITDNFLIRVRGGSQSPTCNCWIDDISISAKPDNPVYWDTNGITAGAGGAAPSGTLGGTDTCWNTDSSGGSGGSIGAWTGGKLAHFAAGTDAVGSYNVSISGTQHIGGLYFDEGTVTLSGGVLQLPVIVPVYVANGLTATINSPLSITLGGLIKSGAGTLVLTGINTYSDSTTISNGVLMVSIGGSCSNSAVTVTNTPGSVAGFGVSVTNNMMQWTCASMSFMTNGIGTPQLKFAFNVEPSTNLAPLQITGDLTFSGVPVVVASLGVTGRGCSYPLLTVVGTAPTNVPSLSGVTGTLAWGETDSKTLFLTVPAAGLVITIR